MLRLAGEGHATGRLIVLNRTPETLRDPGRGARRRTTTTCARDGRQLPRSGFVRAAAWQFFTHLSMSSLTRRIIFLNVAGLVVMMIGILYLSQFRAGLIDARIQSLMIQGEIIANAVAASGTDRSRRRHHRSAAAARTAARRELRSVGDRQSRARLPDQSGARRADPAAAGVADQHARAHLRARRHVHARQPRALRRAALRPAAAEVGAAELHRAAARWRCGAG